MDDGAPRGFAFTCKALVNALRCREAVVEFFAGGGGAFSAEEAARATQAIGMRFTSDASSVCRLHFRGEKALSLTGVDRTAGGALSQRVFPPPLTVPCWQRHPFDRVPVSNLHAESPRRLSSPIVIGAPEGCNTSAHGGLFA